MADLTRDVLNAVAARAYEAEYGLCDGEADEGTRSALDAVLPRIADAIEKRGNERFDAPGDGSCCTDERATGYSYACDDLADLVRSLMGDDGE